MFKDRKDAGRKLAEKLANYRGKDTVVLALPRGGVVVGYEVAKALGAPLDIVVVRKVGHPENPEYAVCTVDERGELLCNESARALVPENWIVEEAKRQTKEARRRLLLYRGEKKPADIAGRVVILVDDGIATGLSMRLAIRSLKARRPKKIIVAAPVASMEAVQEIQTEGAEEILVLLPPEEFAGAVGAHFQNFTQVEDEEVIKLLA